MKDGAMAPEERVGKTANGIIFLGILYTLLTIIALVGARDGSTLGIDLITLGVSLSVIGLGYGIRYGSGFCLAVATGLFACLFGYFGYTLLVLPALRPALRWILSGWALLSLCRSIPALRILQQTHRKPLRTSRYGELFLRRKAK